MTLMSPDDMIEVRYRAKEAFPDLANIYHAESLPAGRGGLTPEKEVIGYQQVPCRLSQANRVALKRLMRGRPTVNADYILSVPHDFKITEDMWAEVKGQAYDVIFVNTDRSSSTEMTMALKRRGGVT